jgi:hypothetical protein
MMKLQHITKLLVIAALACALFLQTACPTRKNTLVIVIVDLTGSVPTEAQSQSLCALQERAAGLLRGDTLIVIPLVGDAVTETPGRILRFAVSERRQAYDQDLTDLQAEITRQLQGLQEQAARTPAKSTDLLGALRLAAEEAQRQLQVAHDSQRTLHVQIVALSDFIQDDTQGLNFKRDPRLANTDAARKFAAEEAQSRTVNLSGATILLGSLRSDDLKLLNQERREALRVFWSEYCRAANAASVNFATDGIGALAK